MNCTATALDSSLQRPSSSRVARPSQQPLQQRLRLRAPLQQRPCRSGGVRAAASPENNSQQQESPSVLDNLERNASFMLQRYDFLSAGLGALCVTTFCVARGQDPVTALWITGASTVVALLLNEMLFNDETHH